jgi:hypothetical protein
MAIQADVEGLKGPIFLQEFLPGQAGRKTNSFKFLSSSVLVQYLRITIE